MVKQILNSNGSLGKGFRSRVINLEDLGDQPGGFGFGDLVEALLDACFLLLVFGNGDWEENGLTRVKVRAIRTIRRIRPICLY